MKFILLIFIIPSLFFSAGVVGAKTKEQEQLEKQIEEVMKARDQMLRMLLEDSDFQDMNSRMEKLMQSFGQQDFFSGMEEGDVVGEYDWLETNTHKILSLKVKQIKDRPLDIKIKNGKITLKGDVESQTAKENKKRITRIHFEREFSIPDGVDEKNPEFENKQGELLIKFKKKFSKQSDKKDLIPITVDPKDQTI